MAKIRKLVTVFTLIILLLPTQVKAATENMSTIGSKVMFSVSESSIKKELNEKIELWKEEPLFLMYGEESIKIPHKLITVDVETTSMNFYKARKKGLFRFWEDRPLANEPLQIKNDGKLESYLKQYPLLNARETAESIKSNISNYLSHHFEPVYVEGKVESEQSIARVVYPNNRPTYELQAMMNILNTTVLLPRTSLSFHELVKDIEQLSEATPTDLSIYSSMLNALFMQTNYRFIERHPHFEQFAQFQPGNEAIVNFENDKDFQVYNPNGYPGKLKMTIEDEQIVLDLYSAPLQVDVELVESAEKTLEKDVVHIENLKYPQGMLLAEGERGRSFRIYRIISNPNTSYEQEERLANGLLFPKPMIIIENGGEEGEPSGAIGNMTGSQNSPTFPDSDKPPIEDMKPNEKTNQYDDAIFKEGGPKQLPNEPKYDKGGHIISP